MNHYRYMLKNVSLSASLFLPVVWIAPILWIQYPVTVLCQDIGCQRIR